MGDWGPDADIIFLLNACFMAYMELKNIDNFTAVALFRRYNISGYIKENYDYLQHSGVEYLAKEIDARIQRGERFE